MIRLDLSYFYRLGTEFANARTILSGQKIEALWFAFYGLKERIEQLVGDPTIGSSLQGVGLSAGPLIAHLDRLMDADGESEFDGFNRNRLIALINNLEIVLTSELGVSPAYFVSDKKPYSTRTLTAEGEALFPMDLPRKIPEAVYDLREAGKCIAFELSTAAAFHIHRAIESVLRRYWAHITKGRQQVKEIKQRNMGVYLNAMKKHNVGDPKVIAALEQIKDLHRNAVIHPEESLELAEAIALVGMANSVATAMLSHLPFVPADPPAPDDASFPQLDATEQALG